MAAGRALALLPVAALLACVVVPLDDEGTSTRDSLSSSGGFVGEASGEFSDAGASTEPVTSASGDELDGGTGFVNNDHADACGDPCDIWNPSDCPNGQKCTAVACEVGSSAWDSHVCRDILGWQGVGESCEYFGTGVDGLDSCELGAMCWNQDADTGLGTCLQFCQGTPASPTCPAASSCIITSNAILTICLPNCNPLTQDCDGNDLCLPDFNDTGFVCVLDASGDMAPYGTPCEFANVCNSGLICIAPESVPEPACEGASGCCSPMCDINAANTCPGVGQVCASLYETGMEPPGYDHMGVCAVPA